MRKTDIYERETIRDDENRRIRIGDMAREDKIRKTVDTLSNISQTFGVILGNLMGLFINIWDTRFELSTGVLRFTLGLFLVGYASYVFCDHCFNTRSTGGCNTADKVHLIVERPGVSDKNDANVISKGSVTSNKTLLHNFLKKNKTILLGMVPICLTFIMYGIVKSTQGSYFLQQGTTMDRSIGPIGSVPLSILLIIGSVFGQCVNALVRELFYKRLRANERLKGILTRIGLGLLCSFICCGTARWSENKRLRVAQENYTEEIVPLSVFYLVPQFISYGAMKHLAGTGLRVFFEYELPESMEEYASGLADTVIGIGVLFGAMAVPITHFLSKLFGGDLDGWIVEDHLDYFYLTLSIFCLLNLLLYAYASKSYIKKRTSPNKEDQKEEGGFELEV